MDGLLLIDKPPGLTSFDVIRRVRKSLDERKAGHTGTLDPAATGLLMVSLGTCTKLVNYVAHEPKAYQFEIVFGAATDTCDDEGEVIESGSSDVDETQLREAMTEFVGQVDQVPPRYSAVHVDGKRAHELARSGVEFKLDPRQVQIHEIELHRLHEGVAIAEIVCGSGTYVRSLARDLGKRLGTVAHARKIRRTRIGSWSVQDAVSLQDLEESSSPEQFVISPFDMLTTELPVLDLDDAATDRVCHGNYIVVPRDLPPCEHVVLTTNDELLAVAAVKEHGEQLRLQPRRVLR